MYYIILNEDNFITQKFKVKGFIPDNGVSITQEIFDSVPDVLKINDYYLTKYENDQVIIKTLSEWISDGIYTLSTNELLENDEIVVKEIEEIRQQKLDELKDYYIQICEKTDSEWLKYNKRNELNKLYDGDEEDKNTALDNYDNATTTYKATKSDIETATTISELESINVYNLMNEYL